MHGNLQSVIQIFIWAVFQSIGWQKKHLASIHVAIVRA